MPEREAQAATTEIGRLGAEVPPIRVGVEMQHGRLS
jgi:hypothetical protein